MIIKFNSKILFTVAFSLFIFFGLFTAYNTSESDYWEHLSSAYQFSQNPFSPAAPYIAENTQSHLLTPYHFFIGLTSYIVKVHPYYIFPFFGVFNILVFLYAVYTMVKNLYNDSSKYFIAVWIFLFFWLKEWFWSGFYNFGYLPLSSVYPFWFTFSVSIIVLFKVKLPLTIYSGMGTVALVAFSVITHPLTALFFICSLIIKYALHAHSNRSLLKVALYVATGIIIAVYWPFYSVPDAVLNVIEGKTVEFAGPYTFFYENIYFNFIPLFGGLIVFYRKIRERKITFVELSFIVFSAIYVFNFFFLHSLVLARFIIYIIFYLQILTFQYFTQSLNKKIFAKFSYKFVFLLLAIPLTLWEASMSLRWNGIAHDIYKNHNLGTHSDYAYFRQMQELLSSVDNNSVVMASMDDSWKIPAIAGVKVVGVKHSNPFISDFLQRKYDCEKFFQVSTNNFQKNEIAKKYFVKYILIDKRIFNADLILNIAKEKENDNYILYKVL